MPRTTSSRPHERLRDTLSKTVTCFLLLLMLSASATRADAQKYRYFGTRFSDWTVLTFPFAGGPIRWRILRNDNPSPTAPGAAAIADITFGSTGSPENRLDFFPNPGNYNGDAADDIVVYRGPDNQYIVRNADGSATYTKWGIGTDLVGGPEGDYDGDGRMDLTIVRATTGSSSPFVWWVLKSSDNTYMTFTFGGRFVDAGDDYLLPGADYTGDGRDDPAVVRRSEDGALTWFVGSTTGEQLGRVTWGDYDTDFVVPSGDYDGDRKADFMVWRGKSGGNGVWYLLASSGNVSYTPFGIPSPNSSSQVDLPLRSGDYDGDGKTDIAVYRPSDLTFYVDRSSGGVQTQRWGDAGEGLFNLPIALLGTIP